MSCALYTCTYIRNPGGAQVRNQTDLVTPLLGGEKGYIKIRYPLEQKKGNMDSFGRKGLMKILKFQYGVSWLFSYVPLGHELCVVCIRHLLGCWGYCSDEEIPTHRSSLVSEEGRLANVSKY